MEAVGIQFHRNDGSSLCGWIWKIVKLCLRLNQNILKFLDENSDVFSMEKNKNDEKTKLFPFGEYYRILNFCRESKQSYWSFSKVSPLGEESFPNLNNMCGVCRQFLSSPEVLRPKFAPNVSVIRSKGRAENRVEANNFRQSCKMI